MWKLLAVLLLTPALSVPALAGDCERPRGDVLIRDTSSVHASHDRLYPLTSTYLDTASTRLVDARRGFRPYDTVYRDGRYVYPRAVRRSRGILRPDRADRPYRVGAPRTGVTVYGNADSSRGGAAEAREPSAIAPVVVIIRDERGAEAQAPADARPPEQDVMEVTIYEGEPEMPEHRGAVIVRSDGTVISVGD